MALIPAQEEEPAFRLDVDVVNTLAPMRDRDGRIVNDLSKDGFVPEENGRQPEIRYFAGQTGIPLTIRLLFDTSLSQMRLVGHQRGWRPISSLSRYCGRSGAWRF